MTIVDGVFLGVVQGITEFLPISSSGHLIALRSLFDISITQPLVFDVLLHFATALAVLVYFRKTLIGMFRPGASREDRRLLWLLLLASVPAACVGFFFEATIEAYARDISVVIYALVIGSLLLLAAEWVAAKPRRLTPFSALGIGFYQTLALIPGISRSGASIAGGLLFGLSREKAIQFAFLLSLPVLLGAGALKMLELLTVGTSAALVPLSIGALTAFIVGLGALHFMVRYLSRHTLYPFVIYRLLFVALLLFAL